MRRRPCAEFVHFTPCAFCYVSNRVAARIIEGRLFDAGFDGRNGGRAHHILQVAMDMESMFKAAGFVPKNIVVGTPGGNNFLNRQDVPTTIGQVTALLNYLRKTYPEAKIIIYGLPAPISMYVIQCRPAMMGSVRAWQKGDRNCVLLLLEKNFVAAWKYLPKGYMSSDGIHFTPTGQIEYDKDIIAGKKALPGMVIL